MNTNINSVVKDLKNITLEKVIFEAITNSIQANANNIEIYFSAKNKSIDDTYQLVDTVKVIDDGEGFNDKNVQSFNTYRSELKQGLGAKGVGRFLYLKLFKQIDIHSLSNTIKFTVERDVELKPSNSFYSETTVLLSTARDTYFLNPNKFEEKVKDHFLPYFKLLNDEDKSVKITVHFDSIEDSIVINSNDIPSFETESFFVKKHQFTFSYILNNVDVDSYDGFYCAANRVVLKNSQLDTKRKFKFFNGIGVKILFLLSSSYFDQNVNDERDEFTINPVQINQQDLYSNLAWADIHRELSLTIKEACLKHGIDVEQEAKKNLNRSIDIAPFLAHYLDKKNEIVLSSDDLIKNAKRDYEEEKQFLRDEKNKEHQDYKIKLSKVVQTELAEYIFDREKTINRLREINDEELLEHEVHKLFMPKYTSSENQLDYRSNNLWLFDDRFMTYDKIFSEVQVKTVFPELANITKRFDLYSIVSNTYEKEKITDIVIIELKRPDGVITPAGAEEQLLEYARYINQSVQQNKIRIWAYAFLKFSPDVEFKLADKSYNVIPTHSQYPIYYNYHKSHNLIVNFMDYSALADDAHTRNQTVINILKGSSFNDD